ncbi:D-amino-acid transaminase [Bacillus swezeyi]|uniref:D-alanine aminotransferase n=1 Tax=Bacillus swezeyi TaxID=1925020 RepID=A0A1R1RW31_9BACI|nr:D-amino-acid transaminase [Bacillus swezeyi]MEC1261736.1 D-amino-acid transaminase [Bacillus swezeyi]MED2926401.1 D-amino-acid transaminase [Bacillus swezeyi]MED2943871.1 D-amino-acid transaminase [Bacillus swezeyi]MED2966036.1 D-amino-acid transaminase [Bacillus swezeyi]MED3070560.1 D-amino-acid transaminase [Bacillus swezeyi]
MKVFFNGRLIERSECAVDIEDRGYQFGDGVYEVIRIYNGSFYTLNEHIARFFKSAAEIGIDLPFSEAELKGELKELIEANQVQDGGLYLQATRGKAPRKHQYEAGLTPQVTAYTFPIQKPEKEQQHGVSVITADDLRWLRCDIKSLNLLYNVMIKQKASEASSFEAILIRDGVVTEGTSSNVYAVKQNVIYTHPATNLILNGITRMKLLELFAKNGWQHKEKAITKDELLSADEVFISSTTAEVIPVTVIDGQKVGTGTPGPLTKEVQKAMQNSILSETAKPV